MSRRFGGFYERRIFPWLNDKLTANAEIDVMRREALLPARGRVVEIGFGSGLNLDHYPHGVTGVVGVEPNAGMRARARARIAAARCRVDLIGGEAERLPFSDRVFDTAVSVLTLCSVIDVARVLAELRRVLRGDGRLIVVEHGLSDDPSVARWQQRLNPLQNVLACGCNLIRPTRQVVERAGFRFDHVTSSYFPGAPRTHGWFTVGAAAKDDRRT